MTTPERGAKAVRRWKARRPDCGRPHPQPNCRCRACTAARGVATPPTTEAARARSERADYTPEELEFLAAVDKYKREHRRPFPALTELLGVLKSLGYRKEEARDAQAG